MATTGREPQQAAPRPEADSAGGTRHRKTSAAIGQVALPLIVYGALALIAFSPKNPLNASELPNGPSGDPAQMSWFLAYIPWAVLHGHNPFVTNYLDYPSGINLASNTSVPLLGFLSAPITLLLGPIATLNILLRLSMAISAAALFLVLRRWCRSSWTAFAGGLVYGFSPYFATHLSTEGHLNLVFAPLPALALVVFEEAFINQRRRPLVVGIVAALFATAQLLISPEVLSDAVVLGAIALVLLVARYPRAARRHLAHGARVVGVSAAAFAVSAGYPLYQMLAGPGHLRGPVQSVSHLQAFHADLFEFFLPGPSVLLAPSVALHAAAHATAPISRVGGAAELGGYLGIPLIALLVVFAIRFRHEPRIIGFAALTAAAALLSLGSRLEVDGHLTSLPLPEAVLAHLPLLDDALPARFGLFVALFAAVVLALGLERTLAVDRAARRPVSLALLVGLAAVAVVAVAPKLPLVSEQPATSSAVTAELNRSIANGAVVLAYPYPDPPYDVAMIWQGDTMMRFKLLGGYATVNGPQGHGQIFAPLLDPDVVQEVLTKDEDARGRSRHYPPPSSNANVSSALCRYLASYRVDTVVYQPTGKGSAAVEALFNTTLGPPTTSAAGLQIWSLATDSHASRCGVRT